MQFEKVTVGNERGAPLEEFGLAEGGRLAGDDV
jgi:hypothetical protein